MSLYEWVRLCFLFAHVCVHQGHHLSTSLEAKTTCCQYWWFLLQYLCGLGSEVASHRQSGVNGACVTLDKRLRALEQSQGRCPVCVLLHVFVFVYIAAVLLTPLFHSTLATITGLILVYFQASDLADDPVIRTSRQDCRAHQKLLYIWNKIKWHSAAKTYSQSFYPLSKV